MPVLCLQIRVDGPAMRQVVVLMSTEFFGTRKLCAESKAFVSAGVDPLSDEFRQDGVALATQEKMREGVSQRQRGDHF